MGGGASDAPPVGDQPLRQSAEITEIVRGFRVRVRAEGTTGVPLAIELGFRDGGHLEGCEPVPGNPGAFLLTRGTGVYTAGTSRIRFGPGDAAHRYVQLRGAEPGFQLRASTSPDTPPSIGR